MTLKPKIILAAVGVLSLLTSTAIAGQLKPGLPQHKPLEAYLYPTDKPYEIHRRSVFLKNKNTGETLHLVYASGRRFDLSALRDLNRLLRDHHVNEICPIDPALFDILEAVQMEFSPGKPIIITSAYRSDDTNENLQRHNHNVADKSLHIQGKAIDFKVPGVSTYRLANFLLALPDKYGVGGVGRYKYHVHVDTGQRRYWTTQ